MKIKWCNSWLLSMMEYSLYFQCYFLRTINDFLLIYRAPFAISNSFIVYCINVNVRVRSTISKKKHMPWTILILLMFFLKKAKPLSNYVHWYNLFQGCAQGREVKLKIENLCKIKPYLYHRISNWILAFLILFSSWIF